MPEMILPGVYIEVRPEGLIVPGQISVGNVGVVGTAARGEPLKPKLLGTYADALREFGDPDAWKTDKPEEVLTLVRALQLVFDHGATTVYGVRVAKTTAPDAATAAELSLPSASGTAAKLTANSPGTWGNDLTVKVEAADDHPVIVRTFDGSDLPVTLDPKPLQSAQSRVELTDAATGHTRTLPIVYDPAAVVAGQAKLDRGSGQLSLGTAPQPDDTVTVTYMADKATAVKVTLRLGTQQEVFTVANGDDLVHDVNDPGTGSKWVKAEAGSDPDEPPKTTPANTPPALLAGGTNGLAGADYRAGLRKLLGVDAHIIVAAGQGEEFGNALAAHCDEASTDLLKRDRIAVVGTAAKEGDDVFTAAIAHDVNSGRVILVTPGIKAQDSSTGGAVVLTGAYTAAAFAGKLASLSPHVSLTNKPLQVDGLQAEFEAAQLTQLVKARVLALEKRQGFRVVKGITTDEGPFSQITIRRIVDYAKYGVRSAATPYIGLLNNVRVRGAMQATINTFLDGMVKDEMLTEYKLAVTATREEERQGIARVTMTLLPTFSIDYIRVTMFLE